MEADLDPPAGSVFGCLISTRLGFFFCVCVLFVFAVVCFSPTVPPTANNSSRPRWRNKPRRRWSGVAAPLGPAEGRAGGQPAEASRAGTQALARPGSRAGFPFLRGVGGHIGRMLAGEISGRREGRLKNLLRFFPETGPASIFIRLPSVSVRPPLSQRRRWWNTKLRKQMKVGGGRTQAGSGIALESA